MTNAELLGMMYVVLFGYHAKEWQYDYRTRVSTQYKQGSYISISDLTLRNLLGHL